MVAQLMLLLFLGFMIYWWGAQGLFSAVLHLVAVIVAGSIALGVWEWVVLDLDLITQMPDYAWGVGLLVPFALLLILVRLGLDFGIKANVNFNYMTDRIAGGACGLIAGILVSGVAVIGIGFMTLGAFEEGFKRYTLDQSGKAEPTGILFPPVDRLAASFFNTLSVGSFSTPTPLRDYQPDLDELAGMHQINLDPSASRVAAPSNLEVGDYYLIETPVQDEQLAVSIGDEVRQPLKRLVVVQTKWNVTPKIAYDRNGLNVLPVQVWLVTEPLDQMGQRWVRHAPKGAGVPPLPKFLRRKSARQTRRKQSVPEPSQDESELNRRHFQSFKDGSEVIVGVNDEDTITWAFVIPQDQKPRYLRVRHLRLELPHQAVSNDVLAASKALSIGDEGGGGSLASAKGTSQVDQGGARQNPPVRMSRAAKLIRVTYAMPRRFSKNAASGLKYEGSRLVGGSGRVKTSMFRAVGGATTVNSLWSPSHKAVVRIELDDIQARGFLGDAKLLAAGTHPIWLEDAEGNRPYPVGWIMDKANRDLIVEIDPDSEIRSAKQLPSSSVPQGHTLFFYFYVNRGTQIVRYHLGRDTTELEPPLIIR